MRWIPVLLLIVGAAGAGVFFFYQSNRRATEARIEAERQAETARERIERARREAGSAAAPRYATDLGADPASPGRAERRAAGSADAATGGGSDPGSVALVEAVDRLTAEVARAHERLDARLAGIEAELARLANREAPNAAGGATGFDPEDVAALRRETEARRLAERLTEARDHVMRALYAARQGEGPPDVPIATLEQALVDLERIRDQEELLDWMDRYSVLR